MGQRGESTNEWYLIAHARHGDMVIRVRSAMSIGETASGELSFHASTAQLELDALSDGRLVLRSMGDRELVFPDGEAERGLVLNCPAEIRLEHNVLQLVTDFLYPQVAVTKIEVRAERSRPSIVRPAIEAVPRAPLSEPPTAPLLHDPPVRIAARPRRVDDMPVTVGAAPPPEPPRRRSFATPVMAGLALIAAALMYPVMREDGMSRPVEQVEQPELAPGARPPIEPPNVATDPVATNALPDVAEEQREAVVEHPEQAEPAPPPPETVVSIEPRAKPEGNDRSTVLVSAPKPKDTANRNRSRNAEFALHALSSADLALAEGRLTTPPRSSAYALYKRALALDPGSAEAQRGLQSVRQGLIDRALAQLAGGALEDARKSLQSAAETGADPMLVANLRNEVDYRQRMSNP